MIVANQLSRGTPRYRAITVLALLLVSLGVSAGELRNPRRLAMAPGGELLVSDRGGLIVAVDRGDLSERWSFRLDAEGAPFGLAVLGSMVLVGNTTTSRVEAFQLTWLFADGFESAASGPGGPAMVPAFVLGGGSKGVAAVIGDPIGIAVSVSQRLILVLDAADKRVKVFDDAGVFQYQFAPVDGSGRVLSPVSINVDQASNEVLVGDYGDPSGDSTPAVPARILRFDLSGQRLSQIDGSGFLGSNFRFARVQGMSVGGTGRIYAADPLGGRILVFDAGDGSLLETLGAPGNQIGELMVPIDTLLDPATGDLFIVNNRGARPVEVMRAVETLP